MLSFRLLCLASAFLLCWGETEDINAENNEKEPLSCLASLDLYPCASGDECVSVDHVCDGKPDCKDASDEGGRCNSKSCVNSLCQHWCIETPKGPVCWCKAGYSLSKDGKSCEDVDECSAYPPPCSQLCHNKFLGGYQCGCVDGYVTRGDDGRGCRAIGAEATLVFSTQQPGAIYERGLRSAAQKIVYGADMGRVTDVVLSMRQHRLYWIDSERARIMVSDRDGSDMKPIVQHGLAEPVALEYEWRTRHLYVADPAQRRVYACVTDGSVCVTVRDVNMAGLLAMALHPLMGIFFTSHCPSLDDPSIVSVIQMHTLDGQRSAKFFPMADSSLSLGCASSLAVDTVLHELYWADTVKGTIEKAPLVGPGHRVLLENVRNPFGVAIFEDRIYWTNNSSIFSANKFTGDEQQVELHTGSSLHGFHIHHANLQNDREKQNPCWNSFCSHVCALTGPDPAARHLTKLNFTCLCPEGMILEGYMCKDDGHSPFLLISQGRHVLQLYPNSPGHHVEASWTLQEESAEIISLGYDAATQNVFLSDVHSDRIMRIPIFHENPAPSAVITDSLYTVESIAVDWISQNLYWLDTTTHQIDVSLLDGTSRAVLLKNLHTPRALALLPTLGYLVYTDWYTPQPSITRCHMSGENCTTIVTDPAYVLRPVGVAVDAVSRRVFWADAGKRHIMAVDLDGGNAVVLGDGLIEPFALTVLKDKVYWFDRNSTTIKYTSIDSSTGQSGEIYSSHARIFSILSVDRTRQHTGSNGCSLSHNICSHLCLPTPNNHYVCACPPGYMLSNDGYSCLDTDNCDDSWFRCPDRKCVPPIHMCNGEPHCEHGEDEYRGNCDDVIPDVNCGENSFFCLLSRQCIPQSDVCDEREHCSKGEDEAEELCANRTCPADQFKCDNRKCKPNNYRCDGILDCDDGSDEAACPCSEFAVRCEDSGLCVEDVYVCDGHWDCEDGTDEKQDCDALLRLRSCMQDEWQCADGSCINNVDLCDDFPDCLDKSDETVAACPNGVTCQHDDYACRGGRECIPRDYMCDGDLDCEEGDDEEICEDAEVVCNPAEFRCRRTEQCVLDYVLCDGINDCEDASDEDEVTCPSTERVTTTTPKQSTGHNWGIPGWSPETGWCTAGQDYMCTSGDCVPLSRTCDDRPHCRDGSDEGGDCGTACYDNGGCSDVCTATPKGPVCSCPKHYRLDVDKKTCNKKLSCSHGTESHPVCSHRCEETREGYKCHCNPGYYPDFDGSCKAHVTSALVGEGANILYNTLRRSDIMYYIYRPHGHHSNPSPLTGFPAVHPGPFDFLAESKELVYYDVHKREVSRSPVFGFDSTPVWTSPPKCERLAVDWIAHNVYLTDATPDSAAIWVCSLATQNLCAKLVKDGLEKPMAISLYPSKGLMFWSDSGSHRPHISSAWMDGTHRKELVQSDLREPNGLTVDMELDKIYWADARTNKIEVANLDGTGRRLIGSSHQEVFLPHNLAVFEDYLYWTDWVHRSINRFNKFSGQNYTKIISNVAKAVDMKILHTVLQPQYENPCDAMSCESLCLLVPGGATCQCPYLQRPLHGNDHTTCTASDPRNPPVIVIDRDSFTPSPHSPSNTDPEDKRINCPPGGLGCDEEMEGRIGQTEGQWNAAGAEGWWIWFIVTMVVIAIVTLVLLLVHRYKRKSSFRPWANVMFHYNELKAKDQGGNQEKNAGMGADSKAFENPIYAENHKAEAAQVAPPSGPNPKSLALLKTASEESLEDMYRIIPVQRKMSEV